MRCSRCGARIPVVLHVVWLAVVLLASLSDPSRLPAVLTFLFILFRLQPQVQRLDASRVKLAASGAPVRAVMGFLAEDDKPYLRDGTRQYREVREAIRLEGVTFRYDAQAEDEAALREVTAEIPARRTTAIVRRGLIPSPPTSKLTMQGFPSFIS